MIVIIILTIIIICFLIIVYFPSLKYSVDASLSIVHLPLLTLHIWLISYLNQLVLCRQVMQSNF